VRRCFHRRQRAGLFRLFPIADPNISRVSKQWQNPATKAAVEGYNLTIHTPLINLTKAQIIKLGVDLGVDYSLTHSCYDPSPEALHAGMRQLPAQEKGFEEAGINDVTRYLKK